MNEDQSNLVSRHWNGTPISRRTTDGYINATAMCKANGKEWKHYFENDRTHKYLEALSSSVGIPTHELFQSKGGNGGGTWIHPNLAVELARWISPPFAVWMNQWFLEGAQQVQPAPTDGYINASAMCRANGKQWNAFFRLDGTTRHLEALADSTGIPVVSLYQSETGRNGGTWVHPQGDISQHDHSSPSGRLALERARCRIQRSQACCACRRSRLISSSVAGISGCIPFARFL